MVHPIRDNIRPDTLTRRPAATIFFFAACSFRAPTIQARASFISLKSLQTSTTAR